MTADPIVRICQACDDLVDDLDNLMVRLTRADSVLALYRTYPHGPEAGLWTVIDLANGFVRMLPPTSLDVCVRFARVFKQKHPETTLDDSFTTLGEGRPQAAAYVSPTDASESARPSPEHYSVRVPDLAPVIPIR